MSQSTPTPTMLFLAHWLAEDLVQVLRTAGERGGCSAPSSPAEKPWNRRRHELFQGSSLLSCPGLFLIQVQRADDFNDNATGSARNHGCLRSTE